MTEAKDRRRVYTVSSLLAEVRGLLDAEYGEVQVEGEIGQLTRAASGHWYFSLKEGKSTLRCAMFRGANIRVRFAVEEGVKVRARGGLSIYAERGDFQLIVQNMERLGAGDLNRMFEELKQRLADAGLFDAERKREIPVLPRTIGVITSASGSVWHDIQNVLARRYPNHHLLLSPVRVQGEGAAAEIAAAIRRQNRAGRAEVLILARGGGSLEDLWAFNEEAVAYAIAESHIPIISAVGHETDFTIADFVADVRAPTPSAAAELVLPSKAEKLAELRHLQRRLNGLVRTETSSRAQALVLVQRSLERPRFLQERQQGVDRALDTIQTGLRARHHAAERRLNGLERRLAAFEPRRRLGEDRRTLEDLRSRVRREMELRLHQSREEAGEITHRLLFGNPRERVVRERQTAEGLHGRSVRAVQRRLALRLQQVEGAGKNLVALGPEQTLRRGYSIVWEVGDGERRVVRDASALQPGQTVEIQPARGRARARIEGPAADDD